jgi:hypothetical protein
MRSFDPIPETTRVLKQDLLESREISSNERGRSESICNLQTTMLLVSKAISAEAATAMCGGAERRSRINTVLIHDTGWVKVPVPFPALAVAAAKNEA